MPICQETPVRRIQNRPTNRLVRPSLFDPYVAEDRWITACYLPNCLIVYMNNQPVSLVAGSALEQATFNSMLFNMRHRYPRRAIKAVA